ncbi:ATP-binding cassette, sub-family F, member 2 [Monoraphidium neglectum]|uniref:ATP-binding cassette, sub-family F, member 2 n=1 Tax=Monoraphidium neglectum TaxID=145388 RepID=A0A0D2J9Y3_9CHLO|nr:ATP-binding cassette, sub-family F, member 2 [Monoraphidium neglectum]KIY96582.1 ATP-binding cassette, sub-family F, member 2 [Monoraphidium neglectum]|eukprot:XP_013895602.1 ATP-binding cassette, sub-family F, member 2 [Monoraphidium neglectum]
MTVIEFFQHTYPNTKDFVRDVDMWRAFLGRYGVSGKMQTTKISHLSEGQKSRIVFGMLCMKNYNLLLLDEPTNHLDIEAIDSLAEAINHYKGGVVLVSHDFRLIDQVAKEIWVCENKTVHPWSGNIRDYKKALAKKMGAEYYASSK